MTTRTKITIICGLILLVGLLIKVGRSEFEPTQYEIQRPQWITTMEIDTLQGWPIDWVTDDPDSVNLMWQGVFVEQTADLQIALADSEWTRKYLAEGIVRQVPEASYIGAYEQMGEPVIKGTHVVFYKTSEHVFRIKDVPGTVNGWWYVPYRCIFWYWEE